MAKMRTVICLLRNDLRIHDNEVVPSFPQTFLDLGEVFDFQKMCRCCSGPTRMGTTSSLSSALTRTTSKELGTSTSQRQVQKHINWPASELGAV